MAENTFSVELAIRAGTLAKAVLRLHGMQHPEVAHLEFLNIVTYLRELDDFLQKSQKPIG